MGRVVAYLTCLIIYFGLSVAYLQSNQSGYYNEGHVQSSADLGKLFDDENLTVVLVNQEKVGHFIKNYNHTYQVIHLFSPPETITLQVSEKFYKDNFRHIGMALYQRKALHPQGFEEVLTPTPPGTLFINDIRFGIWQADDKAKGKGKKWFFYRSFRHLHAYFGHGRYRADERFVLNAQKKILEGKAYFGPIDPEDPRQERHLFGLDGRLTRKNFPQYFESIHQTETQWSQHFKGYFRSTSNWNPHE